MDVMSIRRRDFLKIAGIAAAGTVSLAPTHYYSQNEVFDPLNEEGIHPVLEKDIPYIFIDSIELNW